MLSQRELSQSPEIESNKLNNGIIIKMVADGRHAYNDTEQTMQ
jgi:hypothetical protein